MTVFQRTTTIETLKEFVRQSNMIEGEPTEPGHPLYDDHLELAIAMSDPYNLLWALVNPIRIHKSLMQSQPSKFPGELRQIRVAVGGNEKMDPIRVRAEYEELISLVSGPPVMSVRRDQEQWAWDLHHRFEWIHPFWDGNGRTGRLFLNAIRTLCGLPWITIPFEDRFSYYRSIEAWEWLKERE